MGQQALGNNQNRTFAVKLVHAGRELSPGQEFMGTELEAVEVRVYRAEDGKRLLAVEL